MYFFKHVYVGLLTGLEDLIFLGIMSFTTVMFYQFKVYYLGYCNIMTREDLF